MKIYLGAFFFLFFYGVFHLVYAIFLSPIPRELFLLDNLIWAVGLFLVNHIFSFFYNFKQDIKKQYKMEELF